MRTAYFFTSHYDINIRLLIESKYRTVSLKIELPWFDSFNDVLLIFYNRDSKEEHKEWLQRSKEKELIVDLSFMKLGYYYLNIYIKRKNNRDSNFRDTIEGLTSNYESFYYESFCFSEIVIERSMTGFSFILPSTFDANSHFIKKIPTDQYHLSKYTLSTLKIESHDPEVIKLAHEICRFSHNDYNRLLCIHDWITKNLYYDCDSLVDDQYIKNSHKALNAINRDKKCVCSDFTYLNLALARVFKIPSIGIVCNAIKNFSKTFHFDLELEKEAHIFSAFYVEDRWVLVDSTWDCSNKIEKGVFQRRDSIYNRKYFDINLDLISATHQFIGVVV